MFRFTIGWTAIAAVAFALVAFGPTAHAQEIRPLDERVATAPGYFVYVLPGERSVQVSVMGTVRAPGFYTVSDGVNLGELLALAGGPALAAQSNEIERTVTIRLYRGRSVRDLIYEASLDDFARDASAYPRLIDGDLVEVTTLERRLRTWRDTLTVVGGVAGVVIAVVQVVSILR